MSHIAQAETIADVPGRTLPGFYGHPLLNWTTNGYHAEPGKFFLNVAGNTSLLNIDNLTDDDPDNYANTVNLLHLTVALDQIVNIKPNEGNDMVYQSGKRVGFVMSSSGDKFKVLDLKVVKLFCIYFFKGDELVATSNGQNGDLDILTLDVAGFNLSEDDTRRTQKITAVCPTDKDGNVIEFDGIGIGFGGVDADLIADIAIDYAFIDDLEEVPIIKKYYPNVKANGKGMQTGAQNLINNKLDDGATTAVLNIGGAYYSVINDEPFPAGVEAGFKITTGSALQLDLGSAIQITALTYPKKADGTYDTTAEPIERDITTQVNIVGLELAGGGKSAVTLMTNAKEPFFGLRLKLIKGVEVDLGATVVHYAYVKLPEMPETVYPFEITMDVVPDCEYVPATNTYFPPVHHNGENDYHDLLYFSTVADAPVYTIEKAGELKKDYWKHGFVGSLFGTTDYIRLPIVRKSVASKDLTGEVTFTDDDIFGYITIIKHPGNPSHQAGYYFKYSKTETGEALSGTPIKLSDPGEDGIISFNGISVIETDHNAKFAFDSQSTIESNPTKAFAAAFAYALFVNGNGDDVKDIENAYQLAYDRVRIPARTPDFEIAGKYALDFIKEKDAGNAPDDLATGCDNYLLLRVPDKFDWKTQTQGFDIYVHTGENTAKDNPEYSFTRNSEGKWIAADGNKYSFIQRNGVTKLLLGTVPTTSANKYSVTFHEELTKEYEEHLKKVHGERNYETYPVYGWYPVATKTFAAPEFTPAEISASRTNHSDPWFIHSIICELNLNDATDAHKWYSDNDTNDKIYYNQWVTLPTTAKTRADEETQTVRTTSFNATPEGVNSEMTGAYADAGHSTHVSQFTDTFTGLPQDAPYALSETTRAYIPVVPSGFEGKDDVKPSYIVAEDKSEAQTFAYNDLEMTGSASVEADENAPTEYYNLQGIRVDVPSHGIYIKRRGSTISKVLVR